MPRLFLIVLSIAVLVSTGSAADGTPWVPSLTAFEAGFGARSLGMGHLFIAPRIGAEAVVYHPASLANAHHRSLQGGFGYLSNRAFGASAFATSSGEAVGKALGLPDPGGYFGVAALATRVSDRSHTGRRIIVYDESLRLGQIAYGRRVADDVTIGAGLKVTRTHMYDGATYGSGLDLSLGWQARPAWSVGAIITDITLDGNTCEGMDVSPPLTWVAGVAYEGDLDPNGWSAAGALNLVRMEDEEVRLHIGCEALTPPIGDITAALRAGYNGEGLTVGGGIYYAFLELNYACARLAESDFANDYGHTISLSISPIELINWGRPSSQRVIADHRREQYDIYRSAGSDAFDQGDYTTAHDGYRQALAFADTREQAEEIDHVLKATEGKIEQRMAVATEVMVRSYRDSLGLYKRLYTDSLAVLEKLLKKHFSDERDPDAIAEQIAKYQREGEAFLADDRFYLALGRVGLILEKRPDDSAALDLKARVRMQIERTLLSEMRARTPGDVLQELDSMFLRRISAKPEIPDSVVTEWYQQGINHNRDGEYQRAIDVWQRVYEARPTHPSVLEDIEAARRRLEAEEQ